MTKYEANIPVDAEQEVVREVEIAPDALLEDVAEVPAKSASPTDTIDMLNVINLDEARKRIREATEPITEAPTSFITSNPISLSSEQEARQEVKAISYKPRPATRVDIPALVDIDLSSFASVYRNHGKTQEQLKAELTTMFEGRFDKVGGDWIQLLESSEGNIVGFTMCCPTNKPPIDFVSWEDTTDDGTLESAYDPKGKYIYVVTLTMTPEGAKTNGQDILFLNQIGKMVAEGYEQAYFESRIPGLRSWVKKQCKESGIDPLDLTDDQKFEYAKDYVYLRKEVQGKYVVHDRLLRIFEEVGADFLKVVPDAYQDKPSMNFGVLCTLDNPMPKLLQKFKPANIIMGGLMRFASKHPKIAEKIL